MFSLSGQNKPDIDGEEQEAWDIQVVQLLRWMEGVRWIKEALQPGTTPPPPENPLMEHLNILTKKSVLRAGSAAVGVGRHGRKGELGFMGKGVQFHASEEEKKYYQLLNIYLSTNTYKELFHIQMWPTNAYGNAETQQDDLKTAAE